MKSKTMVSVGSIAAVTVLLLAVAALPMGSAAYAHKIKISQKNEINIHQSVSNSIKASKCHDCGNDNEQIGVNVAVLNNVEQENNVG